MFVRLTGDKEPSRIERPTLTAFPGINREGVSLASVRKKMVAFRNLIVFGFDEPQKPSEEYRNLIVFCVIPQYFYRFIRRIVV